MIGDLFLKLFLSVLPALLVMFLLVGGVYLAKFIVDRFVRQK